VIRNKFDALAIERVYMTGMLTSLAEHDAPPKRTAAPPVTRLTALDIFRGFAVAGMILVNTPGSWKHVWWPLDHAAWDGWTPTDLVFPAFLFAMGVALGLSYPRVLDAADRRRLWLRVVRRSVALIAIGIGLEFLSTGSVATLRLPGVLQRIGLCYAITASLTILIARRGPEGKAEPRWQLLVVIAISVLLAYALLLWFVPVPGFGADNLTPQGNLAGYIDRAIFGTAHMWNQGTDAAGHVVYDPEGLLSTLPSLANVLFGMLAAIAWKARPQHALAGIALGGLALLLAGLALAPALPINKRLWTSSFALFTSGAAALGLAAAMLITRSSSATKLAAPFRIFGMNAILAYIVADLIAVAAFAIHVAPDETLQHWCFVHLRGLLRDPLLASHGFALLVVSLVLVLLIPLDRRGIHLRL
jgi:predicted acyltransferase